MVFVETIDAPVQRLAPGLIETSALRARLDGHVLDKRRDQGHGGKHLPDKLVGGHQTDIGAGDHRTGKEDAVPFKPCTDARQRVVNPGTPAFMGLVSEPFES